MTVNVILLCTKAEKKNTNIYAYHIKIYIKLYISKATHTHRHIYVWFSNMHYRKILFALICFASLINNY